MSQKLHLGNFKQVKKTSEFNEDFLKSYNEESHKGFFLEVDAQYPENLHNFYYDLPFLPKRMKTENVKDLQQSYMIKKSVLYAGFDC